MSFVWKREMSAAGERKRVERWKPHYCAVCCSLWTREWELKENYHYLTFRRKNESRRSGGAKESKHLSSFTIKVGFRRRRTQHRIVNRGLRGKWLPRVMLATHIQTIPIFRLLFKSFNPHGLSRRLIPVYLICKTRRRYMKQKHRRVSVAVRGRTGSE